MKILLTLSFLFTISFSLIGQSNLLKIGSSYRNTNYLSHTGNQKIGFQLGYNSQVSEKLSLEANVGHISNHWDIHRSNLLIFTEKEQTSYIEGIVLFPILRRWIPSGKLKGGIEYIGSLNTFQYAETAVIVNKQLESKTINSSTYYLHEFGLMLEYSSVISSHFVIYASSGFSASLNRAPAYESIITEHFSSGGIGGSSSSLEKRNTAHYRVSVGVGYMF